MLINIWYNSLRNIIYREKKINSSLYKQKINKLSLDHRICLEK